jgi:hypothetical protein
MMIVLDDDSAPDSDEPVDPQILKRSKLSAADRAEIGWESLEDWEFDYEMLAIKIAKLKKKQDGEVDNPPPPQLPQFKTWPRRLQLRLMCPRPSGQWR